MRLCEAKQTESMQSWLQTPCHGDKSIAVADDGGIMMTFIPVNNMLHFPSQQGRSQGKGKGLNSPLRLP